MSPVAEMNAQKPARTLQVDTYSAEQPIVVARFSAPAPCPSELLRECEADSAPGDQLRDRPVILRSGRGAPALTKWSYGSLEAVSVHASIENARASMQDWAYFPAERSASAATRETSSLRPPFSGGAMGYIGYDEGFLYQARPRVPRRSIPSGLPGSWFGLYDAIYARNETTQEGLVLAQPNDGALSRARRLTRCLSTRGRRSSTSSIGSGRLVGALETPVSQRQHEDRIRAALDFIARGEVYQVNLVCPRRGHYRGTPAAAFHRLLAQGAPPFAAYLEIGRGRAVLSASMECFLDVDATSRTATTFPIKGTRARSDDPNADQALAKALLTSEKDLAEHRMIVDLLRNDLGRLTQINSVVVDRCAYLESFPTVHHLTSAIRGTIPSSLHAVDLIRSMFPGGSITGVPKLRAMEIIDLLEDTPRGVSMGTIAYLGPDGALRASVAIRTAEFVDESVTFMVGGGIVADSDPEQEWIETEIKAQSLTRALTASSSLT